MIDEKLVRFIVKSYNLNQKYEERIIRIAIRRLDELFIYGFDETYKYISNLIDLVTRSYERKILFSLDRPISSEKEFTLYEKIGQEDSNLINLVEYLEPSNLEGISIQEAISILEEKSNNSLVELLYSIMDSKDEKDIKLNIKSESIRQNISKIQERLEELTKRFDYNGKIIIPARPIKFINFNPLSIKFGRRKYNKNPLTFFLDNYFYYKNMSRRGLQEVDHGLYEALRKNHQLDAAIPEKRGFTYRGLRSPLECFKLHYEGRNLSRKDLQKIDSGLYATLLKNNQLKDAIPHTKVKINPMRKSHRKHRNYKKNPLNYFNENYKSISRDELQQIDPGLYMALLKYKQLDKAIPEKRKKRRYRSCESPLEYFRKTFGDTDIRRTQLYHLDNALYLSLLKYNQMEEAIPYKVKPKGRESPLTQDDLRNIYNAYIVYERNASKAARALDIYCSQTILRHWKKMGLEPIKAGWPH